MEASPSVKADDLTEEQLEQMLADRRLCREQSLLSGSATVRAEDDDVLAVGPTKVSLSKPLLVLVPSLQLYHVLPIMQLDVT